MVLALFNLTNSHARQPIFVTDCKKLITASLKLSAMT